VEMVVVAHHSKTWWEAGPTHPSTANLYCTPFPSLTPSNHPTYPSESAHFDPEGTGVEVPGGGTRWRGRWPST